MNAAGPAGEVMLRRGALVESVHRVHVAVVDPDGTLRHRAGDAERVTYMRSSAKPFQALPVVEDGAVDAFDISPAELAVMCGSHGGESRHVEVVGGLLQRLGLEPETLACGPHAPMYGPAAAELRGEGTEPGRIHNNCSGKHAGMLALARAAGWDPVGYEREGHPVQERVARELARWAGVARGDLHEGVDGCGVRCFGLPVRAMARAMAALVRAEQDGDPAPRAVVSAMVEHPFMVAGTGRLCTEIMAATRGRVVAKVGAEGVYCAGLRDRKLGIALKVEDGSRRAAETMLVAVLEAMEVFTDEELERLAPRRCPIVPNTRKEPAAHLEPRLPPSFGREGDVRSDARSGRKGEGLGEHERVLGEREQVLVELGAGLAEGDEDRVRRALTRADPPEIGREVEEVLLQSHLFVGFPRALNGLAMWREISGRPAAHVERDAGRADWARRGESLCETIYGRTYRDLRSNVRELHPDMDRWMVEEGYGKVLAREGLDLPMRELVVVAILAVQGVGRQLYSHLRGALRVGCTPARIEAVLRRALRGADAGRREEMMRVWDELRDRTSPERTVGQPTVGREPVNRGEGESCS